jgi:hypothetical protein
MSPFQELKENLSAAPASWLVTGVAGFIGSNLLESLLRLGQTVAGLDNLSMRRAENLAQVRAAFVSACWRNPLRRPPTTPRTPQPTSPPPISLSRSTLSALPDGTSDRGTNTPAAKKFPPKCRPCHFNTSTLVFAPLVGTKPNGNAARYSASEKLPAESLSVARFSHRHSKKNVALDVTAPVRCYSFHLRLRTNLQIMITVRPPDLVQPDFLRHTLVPSTPKSLNSL